MGFEKLIPWIVSIVLLTVIASNLPRVLHALRLAQVKIIQESKASKWGKPIDVTNFNRNK